ncbi:MAG: hypothetical protein DDT42_01133 [candidate division WS2 bacterium]|uniref:Photosynthesis system II assembly factor Ycf48/Hcf136-like domain-containing protein n=1 Tax=Psychracetigena formicireducens TaxID=2986056 RepID=A0A9E2BGQ8_PSYF1|nr:hypothetical protein [Candidatus Psychracetigena formicireducens]
MPNPTNTQVIYAGTGEGVFKTTDGGENWKVVKKGWKGRHISITFLAIDPRDSQVLWAGTTTGVFKSTDGGENWVLMRIRD